MFSESKGKKGSPGGNQQGNGALGKGEEILSRDRESVAVVKREGR
ncbi:hypothetical protein COLO4_05376 [Corchorus olitorius]|uniref:Uncharacterized protein n=1 Tax=Corchorus olitorius TaxID=93759 RepID=A0A1R3KR45_9ROSI|nr:hypothetical protein COLO4_05376 [Corchorus olitorius]